MSRYWLHTGNLSHRRHPLLYGRTCSDELVKIMEAGFYGVYLNANDALEHFEKKASVSVKSNLPLCPGSCDKFDLNLAYRTCRYALYTVKFANSIEC